MIQSFFPELIDIADGSDMLISECGSGNNDKVKGHMCLNEIFHIAENADIARVLVTHIYLRLIR